MEALNIIYKAIAVLLCLLALWSLLKEKSLDRAISIGIVSIPFILRALMIK